MHFLVGLPKIIFRLFLFKHQGPVYTERVLYGKVNADGRVQVVDSLGLTLSAAGPFDASSAGAASASSRAAVFRELERGELSAAAADPACPLAASQQGYGAGACACDGAAGREVTRWNADVRGPAPCRSEGKVLLLASVHDTFPAPARPPQVLWVTLRDLGAVHRLRRAVCLGGGAQDLPVREAGGSPHFICLCIFKKKRIIYLVVAHCGRRCVY
jgi:D-lactate dehydrogenase